MYSLNYSFQAGRACMLLMTFNRFTGVMIPLRHKTVRKISLVILKQNQNIKLWTPRFTVISLIVMHVLEWIPMIGN
jgi:hypothetical protein